jgi:hypothetical protein
MANFANLDNAVSLHVLRDLQNTVGGKERDRIASLFAAYHKDVAEPVVAQMATDSTSISLRERGIAELPFSLSRDLCDEVQQYYSATPCHNAHVPVYSDGILRPVSGAARDFHYGSYSLEQTVRAPHLLELALDRRVLERVIAYLKAVPTLYSINTFWSFPQERSGLTQDWHRDEDDYRFLAVFIYWTDVAVGDGEFYYFPYTHDVELMDDFINNRRVGPWARDRLPPSIDSFDAFRRLNGGNGYANGALYEGLFEKQMDCIAGPAGSAFISDTFGIHRGSLPRKRPRLVTWFRYGLYQNEAYRIDKTSPASWSLAGSRIPKDDWTRYICRLILQDSESDRPQ